MLLEGLLYLSITLVALYIFSLYFNRTHVIQKSDTPPPPSEGFTAPSGLLGTNPDYQSFYDWHSSFCTTWDKVIDQSMQVDQFKLSKEMYIAGLEKAQSAQFVHCNPAITADPDPVKVLPVIPNSYQLYLSTMQYMTISLAKILDNTKRALNGETVDTAEGFQDQQCACLSADAAAAAQASADAAAQAGTTPNAAATIAAAEAAKVQLQQSALQKVIAIIQPIVRSKETLKGQLAIVNSSLDELQTYKSKAESGDLANDVHISE